MRERPILFSGPLVRAILAGRKTQTRRIVKPRTDRDRALLAQATERDEHHRAGGAGDGSTLQGALLALAERCPYGAPGDRLWVRETWGAKEADPPGVPGGRRPQPGDRIVYRADPGDAWQWRDGSLPWRPSIHMPRWASRISLEVTAVRVERLQAISEDDARAEGVTAKAPTRAVAAGGVLTNDGLSAVEVFRDLWDTINRKRAPWASNPFVWVVEFRRVT